MAQPSEMSPPRMWMLPLPRPVLVAEAQGISFVAVRDSAFSPVGMSSAPPCIAQAVCRCELGAGNSSCSLGSPFLPEATSLTQGLERKWGRKRALSVGGRIRSKCDLGSAESKDSIG